jgi:hypothetical protein
MLSVNSGDDLIRRGEPAQDCVVPVAQRLDSATGACQSPYALMQWYSGMTRGLQSDKEQSVQRPAVMGAKMRFEGIYLGNDRT